MTDIEHVDEHDISGDGLWELFELNNNNNIACVLFWSKIALSGRRVLCDSEKV